MTMGSIKEKSQVGGPTEVSGKTSLMVEGKPAMDRAVWAYGTANVLGHKGVYYV